MRFNIYAESFCHRAAWARGFFGRGGVRHPRGSLISIDGRDVIAP
jgi:hypothetical protein